jgi:glycosyltransferase involved in cell wall biosynthesis
MLDEEVQQIIIAPPRLTAYPNELNLFRYHRKYLREALHQAKLISPDFIYQRYSINDLTGVYLRQRLNIPLILEFNGFETWIQRHWGRPLRFQAISERIEAANLRLADLIVVVSQEIANQVQAIGIPSRQILFYPNSVDRSVFDPARFDGELRRQIRQDLGVPQDCDLFTFVGTFGLWHGTDVLASAIRRMIDENRGFLEDRGIHFLLVGDGQLTPKVRSILGETLGAPFVTLAGYRPQAETPGILATSDVCLSPHIPNSDGTPFFGSPTKLFEYMAMAKLIVASDLDQIGWVLRGWRPGEPPPSLSNRSGAAALLLEPGSVDELIHGIHTAAGISLEDRERMGRKVQSFVDRSYTWGKNIEAVLTAFQKRMQYLGSRI